MNSVSSWGVGEAEQRGPYLFIGKLAERVETPAHRVRQAGDARATRGISWSLCTGRPEVLIQL